MYTINNAINKNDSIFTIFLSKEHAINTRVYKTSVIDFILKCLSLITIFPNIADIAKIKPVLHIIEPTAFPIDIVVSPCNAAVDETINSGRVVSNTYDCSSY